MMTNWGRVIGGGLLTFAFVFGIAVASSTTAEAQYRNYGQYRREQVQNRNRERKRDRNWDRNRDGRVDRYQRNRGYGNYDRNRGYGNNGNYGGYGGYSQADLNRGYQNGINTGSSDARRGQSYSPQRSHFYREASTQAFREGFVRGYDQGYRQYAGYGNGRYQRGNTGGSILDQIFRP